MLKLVTCISLCGRFAERVYIQGSSWVEPCMQTRSANLPRRDITNLNIDNEVLLDSCDDSRMIVCKCSLVPRPLLIRYVVWQYAARFLGKTEAIGHVTSAH